MSQYDVVIVGGGPAGLSAALMLGRCLRRVLVVDAGKPRNSVSGGLHGYLTRDGIRPSELLRIGREEIARYDVEFRPGVVTDAVCDPQKVEVRLQDGTLLAARKLLLATGVTDALPDIPGMRDLYGRSVFHCPYCDGWEMRGRPLAVYGAAKPAIGLALSLLTWSQDLVVCIDGGPFPSRRYRDKLREHRIPLRPEKIVRLEGSDGRLERIHFEKGQPLERRGLFFSTEQGQRCELAAQLGCQFDERGHIQTDRRGHTGVCHLYLAGDANGDVQSVIVAAAEGAQAAVAINRELQEEDRAHRTPTRPAKSASVANSSEPVTSHISMQSRLTPPTQSV